MPSDSQLPDSPPGSASCSGSAIGGPEVWNVVAWGDVRECRDIETIMEEVREALELGCRTISIERQGAPTASPDSY
jgi:hypothetical protein